MTNFFFDIETLPCQIPGILDEFKAAVTAPGQYKKADSINEWLRDNRDAEGEKAWLNTSFDGGLGQVCVIGFAVGDDAPSAITVSDLSASTERVALQDFFRVVELAGAGTRFIGHNVIGFDIRFLWQRAMVLGVKPPFCFPRDPKPWGEQAFDTMTAWSGPKDRISMDRLCRIFDIPGKGEMDGSKVWPMVQAGKLADVADYCRADVDRTRALYRRMTFADDASAPIPRHIVLADEPSSSVPITHPSVAAHPVAIANSESWTGPALNLSTMSDRLDFVVGRSFIEERLGFAPAEVVSGHGRWSESDWPRICAAIAAHVLDIGESTCETET